MTTSVMISEQFAKDDEGRLHREDGPAYISATGAEAWLQHGQYHREDGPALIRDDGHQEWWKHGKRHRDDGPAVTREDGQQQWWKDGELRRVGAPAIICPDSDAARYRVALRQQDGLPGTSRSWWLFDYDLELVAQDHGWEHPSKWTDADRCLAVMLLS